MILNDVDNMMLGNAEISKLYLGSTPIWERSGGGRVLPAGYTETGYCEFSGSKAPTGFTPSNGKLMIDAGLSVTKNNTFFNVCVLSGSGYDSPWVSIIRESEQWGAGPDERIIMYLGAKIMSSNNIIQAKCNFIGEHDPRNAGFNFRASLSFNEISIQIDNQNIITETASSYLTGGLSCPIWIGSDSDGLYAKIRYLKLYDDANTNIVLDPTKLMRDYVPAIRNSDNKTGLYDFVTHQFIYP